MNNDPHRASIDQIRERWRDVGPWRQTANTPWGSEVIHVEFGEAYVGTSFRSAPPSPKAKEEARRNAEERAQAMRQAAGLVAGAPDDVRQLLDVIDSLESRLAIERDGFS